MIGGGGILGSIFFGILSDIYGRRTIIRITLFISTIATFLIFGFCVIFDSWYIVFLKDFNKTYKIIGNDSSYNHILSYLYAQNKIRNRFDKYFMLLIIYIFLLSSSLFPLLKSCIALLVENSKGDLDVLINFRKYNNYSYK